MCGRLNVVDDPLTQWVCDALGIEFSTTTNTDLRPTHQVATVGAPDAALQQVDTVWGIKPSWSKSLLINAQAETVAEKRTFKRAFAESRCVVPCTGYYEWRDEGGKRKQKYSFTRADGEPLLMAGIYYPGDDNALVTLTTAPNQRLAEYHHRMPVFILPGEVDAYLKGTATDALPLCTAIDGDYFAIDKAS
ncbi:SOS response-associated peptidase [Gilvimarinus agarilyticus]|uniref:SOS response-associated peptidase n=1 Tax=Gilvimarinus agarilyticus TaxID=679259 RepID=UPI000698F4E8|nr:SOS response-associated peptidase [Gilvimarinus agarilyticus]